MSKTTRRIGRRGASLLVWGLAWLLAGLPLLFVPGTESEYNPVVLRLAAAAFVVAGAAALFAATKRSPRADRWGFIPLSTVGAMWVIYNATLTAQVLSLHHGLAPGLPYLSTAVVDTLLVVKINIDAGWPEPTQPVMPKVIEVAHEALVEPTGEDDHVS